VIAIQAWYLTVGHDNEIETKATGRIIYIDLIKNRISIEKDTNSRGTTTVSGYRARGTSAKLIPADIPGVLPLVPPLKADTMLLSLT
jgi:hypothetical protein